MRAFAYVRATDAASAMQAHHAAQAQFLAGGTTLLDLMKLDVMRPEEVVDVNDLSAEFGDVHADARGLHLGAFAHMADVADNPDVKRDYPVIAQSLMLAASAQIRNMATLGGNVLQRTRCSYFRDVSWKACNKRNPGSGCAALEGNNRKHAVLGTSGNCIATYAGDFAQALVALDADVEIVGGNSARRMRFEELHVAPGNRPDIETKLQPGELITGFFVPASPVAKRSLYLKVRDRESYEFALASAAVALDMDASRVNDARIALGGVATKPWRSRDAEAALKEKPLTEENARAAADAAFADAAPHGENQYKIELGKRTLVRALLQVAEG
ncbi:MAG TPA: xanthine dehydrogenase family protein subunit M [Rhizomicrobium sp.]